MNWIWMGIAKAVAVGYNDEAIVWNPVYSPLSN